MGSIEIIVGRLLCRPLREYLDKQKFLYGNISYIESKGFLERSFVIKSADAIRLREIDKDISAWIRELDEESAKS